MTESGMGLIGVRVSTTLPNEGFTMTRDNGWFDLMVNGGGPVMLQFGRNPYPPLRFVQKRFLKQKIRLDVVRTIGKSIFILFFAFRKYTNVLYNSYM